MRNQGVAAESQKRAKNVVFRPKIDDFLAIFAKIFKITKNHIITLFDQILGHFEHFWAQIVIFKAFLDHFC